MIYTKLLILPLLVYLTKSATKHFVGTYAVPLQVDAILAYPIDECVNYEVTFDGTLFGKYTCNVAGDTVTFTKYGVDETCATESAETEIVTYTMNAVLVGDPNSFSCTGDDNYAEVNSCTATYPSGKTLVTGDDGEAACCPEQFAAYDDNSGCRSQLQATNVCFKGDDGYHMTMCNNETIVTNLYSDNICNTKLSEVSLNYNDYCGFYQKVGIVNFAVYRRLLKCFESGVDIATEDDYCPFPLTFGPTKQPTTSPTKQPTVSPKDDSNSVIGYIIKYAFILVIGVVMYI